MFCSRELQRKRRLGASGKRALSQATSASKQMSMMMADAVMLLLHSIIFSTYYLATCVIIDNPWFTGWALWAFTLPLFNAPANQNLP